jgi:hypothetical protein
MEHNDDEPRGEALSMDESVSDAGNNATEVESASSASASASASTAAISQEQVSHYPAVDDDPSAVATTENSRITDDLIGRMQALAPLSSNSIRSVSVPSYTSATSHQAMLRQQATPLVSMRTDNNENTTRVVAAAVNNNININPSQRRVEAYNFAASNNNNNNNVSVLAARMVVDLSVPTAAAAAPEESLTQQSFSEDYTTSTNNGWSIVETQGGTPPSARSLHAAALLNGTMYVFGGYDGVQRVNTFHAFSFAEKRWSPVLPSALTANPPSPRDRHVAVAFGNSFYVHGGFDGTSRVSDFWGFDFSSMTWREVVVLQGRPPSPRHSHAAVVHRHSLFIFGVSTNTRER